MKHLGLMMVIAGCVIVVAGLFFVFSDKIPFLGKLPGDIRVEGEKTSFHFPIVTCIVISIILTLVLNLVFGFFRR